MARCRKKHDFGPWQIYRYDARQGMRYVLVEDPEKYLKEKKERAEKEKRKARSAGFWVNEKVLWRRVCKKCKKRDEKFSHYDEKPKDYEVPVKIAPSLKVKKELVDKKETKISKGWLKN